MTHAALPRRCAARALMGRQGRSGLSRLWAIALIFCVVMTLSEAQGQALSDRVGILDRTFLLDLRAGSLRSRRARELSVGGYELDDGTPVDFADWYTPSFPEMNLIFLTAITPSFGITWGVSTGERGEKYRIDPGLWLGFVYRYNISPRQTLSLSASTLVGGDLREQPCRAFYRVIDDFATVNCRLAASTLPPRETLQFLERKSGRRESRIQLRYEIRF